MNTTRRIHLNPQSKGNLGKSFEAEFRTAWLDKLGVPWNGSDLDDRHHTFANRHPQACARISSATSRRAKRRC
jgi:Zn-dependent M32 family carboxypeptidase